MSVMRTAIIALVILSVSGCGKTKRNQCNTIRSKVTAEMKATEEIVKHVTDPKALGEHASLLKGIGEDLAGLEIEDVPLKNAVSNYVKAVRGLSQGYRQASAAYRALAQGDMEKVADQALPGGTNMIVYDTMIKSPRQRIAEVCSKH